MTDPVTAATPGTKVDPEVKIADIYLFGLLDDIKTILSRAWITCPIFIGHEPPSPATCVTLYEYAGEPPNTLVGTETPGLQVRLRYAAGANDYQEARALAERIYSILHDRRNFQEGKNRYTHIKAQAAPFSMGRDALNRLTFISNYLVRKDRRLINLDE